MTKPTKIVIARATPADFSCAIVAARTGAQVVVRAWNDRVGHRLHDDFQGLESRMHKSDVVQEIVQRGMFVDFDFHSFDRGTVFGPAGWLCLSAGMGRPWHRRKLHVHRLSRPYRAQGAQSSCPRSDLLQAAVAAACLSQLPQNEGRHQLQPGHLRLRMVSRWRSRRVKENR